MTAQREDVIVIGAGLAGLMAARDLARAGLSVIVLDARDRVGGRVYSRMDESVPHPIELGAEFIEGPQSLSWRLLREGQAALIEAEGESWQYKGGQLCEGDAFRTGVDAAIEKLEKLPRGPDETLRGALQEALPGPQNAEARVSVERYAEGYDASPAGKVSLRWFLEVEASEPGGEGAGQFHTLSGNDRLARTLADELGGRVHLNTVAREVRWSRGRVEVSAGGSISAARVFSARACVITVPVGVWQARAGEEGALTFFPDVQGHRAAASRLAMGAVVKVTLRFRDRFWEDVRAGGKTLYKLKFLQTGGAVPTFWTRLPAHAPMLVAWAGGPAAERLGALAEDELRAAVLGELAGVLSLERGFVEGQLLGWHFHDWARDPYSRGAYSYVPEGALPARDALSAPVQETLFFAGEATAREGHTATMEGALMSGQRAAREVLSALKREEAR